jgi:radical SAM-linked protein
MKVRLRFSKVGKIRWTSHRDVARMWERAFKRIGLPVATTEGFTPRPKISFGLALPTGHESVAEYLDVTLVSDDVDLTGLDLVGLPARLTAALPTGLDVTAAAVVDASTGSLQEIVTSCSWELEAVGGSVPEITALVERALAAESIVITRSRKGSAVTDDVRPSIVSVFVKGPVVCETPDHLPGAVLVAELATQPRGLRPAEFLLALSPELVEGHARRTHQWSLRDGAQPLLEPTDAPHATVRAS